MFKIRGLKIWRIENFKVVPWPLDQYGKFMMVHYLCKENKALRHDIHFWLGKYTTKDEAGTAAYKTVELDNYLNTGPVEHREIQGYESRLFLSYFKNFVIMKGGIESGFNIVKPIEYQPQLFHIKSVGKTLTCTSVPISCDSLNTGDVFVLDQGLKIYQWNGSKAAGIEKHKAMEFASALKNERHGKPVVTVFEQDDNDADPFWDGVGGKNKLQMSLIKESDKILFRLSNSSGKMIFKEEARNDIKLFMLDTDDIFIVDVQYEVFIWIGSKSNVIEKSNSFKYAMNYMEESGKATNIPITRVIEGNESGSLPTALARKQKHYLRATTKPPTKCGNFFKSLSL
ncbi:hypothetical protein U3516DRAFT_535262 [Neocallimastix sp. 'constans']